MQVHLYALAPVCTSPYVHLCTSPTIFSGRAFTCRSSSLLFTITTSDMRRTLHAWLVVATVKSFDDALTFRGCRCARPSGFQQLNLSQTAVDNFLFNALGSLGRAGTFLNHRKTVASCVVHFACDVMCRDVPSSLFCLFPDVPFHLFCFFLAPLQIDGLDVPFRRKLLALLLLL